MSVTKLQFQEVFLRVMEAHDHDKVPEPEATVEEGFSSRLRRRFTSPEHCDPLDNSLPTTTNGSTTNVVAPILDDWDKINLATKRLHGGPLLRQQMKALHIKRFHNLRRSKKSFFCEILLPAIFVCLAMVITLLAPVPREQPPLEVSPEKNARFWE